MVVCSMKFGKKISRHCCVFRNKKQQTTWLYFQWKKEEKKQTILLCWEKKRRRHYCVQWTKKADIIVFNEKKTRRQSCVFNKNKNKLKASGVVVCSMGKKPRHWRVLNEKMRRHWVVAICVANKKHTRHWAPHALWSVTPSGCRTALLSSVPSFCLCFLLSSAPLRFSGLSVVGSVPASLRASQLLSVLPAFCRNATARPVWLTGWPWNWPALRLALFPLLFVGRDFVAARNYST